MFAHSLRALPFLLLSLQAAASNRFIVDQETAVMISERRVFNQAWFNDLLSGKDIIGLEVLIASTNQSGSRTGHSALHFIDSDEDFLNDLIISFEMEVTDPHTLLRDAVSTNRSSIIPYVYTFRRYFIEYFANTPISFERVIIPTDQTDVHNILRNLQMLMVAPSIIGRYNVFSNNCHSALLTLLNESGMQFQHMQIIDLPSSFVNSLSHRTLSPYPSLFMRGTSSLSTINRVFETLVALPNETPYLEEREILYEELAQMLIELTDQDLLLLRRFWRFDHGPIHPAINHEIIHRNLNSRDFTNEALIEFQRVPQSLYKRCFANTNCHEQRLQDSIQVFGLRQMTEFANTSSNAIEFELERASQLFASSEMIERLNSPRIELELMLFFRLLTQN